MSCTQSAPITIPAENLLLRPFRVEEIDEQWTQMVTADALSVNQLPDEWEFKTRLRRSGHLLERWIDLAIDVNGRAVGRIQTFVPPDRVDASSIYNVGIGLHQQARGHTYGRVALAVFTDWLFENAGATQIEGRTDPENAPMQRVFHHLNWTNAGLIVDGGRNWLLFIAPQPSNR